MAELIVIIIFIYLGLGFIAGFVITFFGVKKLDPAAKEGTIGFKLLIVPGLAVFWPLFVMRWIKGSKEPPLETNAHREAAMEGKQ